MRGAWGVVHGEAVTRGAVIALTGAERRERMLYLAGERPLSWVPGLDHMYATRVDKCPDIFYLLKDYNGGKDPRATDPADRWSKPGSTFVNRTADCIGGQAWCGGWDRYQPARFAHIYGGWINTDSMRQDAGGPAKCFHRLDRPELGCYVVFASGSAGHQVGHIGGVVDVPAEYAPTEREWWKELGVVDVAARIGRANKRTTGLTWFNTNAWFVTPIMIP